MVGLIIFILLFDFVVLKMSSMCSEKEEYEEVTK